MDPGFPRIIGESWNGIPDDIDSVFSLNNIGKAFNLPLILKSVLIIGINIEKTINQLAQTLRFTTDKHS